MLEMCSVTAFWQYFGPAGSFPAFRASGTNSLSANSFNQIWYLSGETYIKNFCLFKNGEESPYKPTHHVDHIINVLQELEALVTHTTLSKVSANAGR